MVGWQIVDTQGRGQQVRSGQVRSGRDGDEENERQTE